MLRIPRNVAKAVAKSELGKKKQDKEGSECCDRILGLSQADCEGENIGAALGKAGWTAVIGMLK